MLTWYVSYIIRSINKRTWKKRLDEYSTRRTIFLCAYWVQTTIWGNLMVTVSVREPRQAENSKLKKSERAKWQVPHPSLQMLSLEVRGRWIRVPWPKGKLRCNFGGRVLLGYQMRRKVVLVRRYASQRTQLPSVSRFWSVEGCGQAASFEFGR